MAYHDRLAAAWAEHLKPRAADAPTVVSTFAGAGGSSLGYSMAGFDERLAVEWDEDQARTFATNFPHVPLYHGDIAQLTDEVALRMSGLKPGELDVFDGSPPCQGFSTSGKRNADDSRNQLYLEYVRLLRAFRPRMFVMENVKGMLIGKMKPIFADIMRELRAAGYRVSARVLVAGHYGVPQVRQRLIFIGVRDDIASIEPSHPAPQCWPVTLREALFGVVSTPDECAAAHYREGSPYGAALMRLKPGQSGNDIHPGGDNYYFNLYRLEWNKPAGAIQKSGGSSSWACEACHPEENRKLTIPELKRVGSFPDGYVITGDFKHQWAAIGNCVPPLFMRAIAGHVRGLLAQAGDQHAEPQKADSAADHRRQSRASAAAEKRSAAASRHAEAAITS
ncbi:DNA cytosine methyltransferase [Paraburkholderia youngii]|uniref:DNA cytosine methyltransferase n=1 Tax=Paraburkholderia youngii TaxID=2782701 RepID=UPI003D206C04